jgi:hyperosmotically inducible protein
MNSYRFHSISFRNLLMAAGLSTGLAIGMPAIASSDAAAPVAHSDSMGAAISDSDITVKVKLKLADIKDLRKSDISVTTTNGVVTLNGTATSADAKSAAEAAAISVAGVKSVDDELTTPSSGPLMADAKSAANTTKHEVSDSWITTKVKSELLADSVTKGFDVKVVTTGGVVVLRGKLANHDAIDHVKDVVEKVDGVKSVDTTGLTVPYDG